MEFGRIPIHELEQTNLKLPPEPESNNDILAGGNGNTRIYVGCAKFSRKEWVGTLYPPGAREKNFLKYYAQQFNSIEFNGFFYQLYPPEQVKKWIADVPPGFRFCPKFTGSVTHQQRLRVQREEIDAFLETILAFGPHLGPVFLMPHPGMGPGQFHTISTFLEALPQDIEVFLELRHSGWFSQGYHKELLQFLIAHKRGTIITDTAGQRDIIHMHLSVPECFIRFVGNAPHPSDYSRIDEWVARIGNWMQQGLETCYFFMHQHDESLAPGLLIYFIEQMNMHNGTNIPIPTLYTQPRLF